MNKNKTYVVFSVLLMMCQIATARPWVNYVKKKVPPLYDLNTLSEVYNYKKKPFTELLAAWEKKETQEQQIKYYEKYGIKRSRAQMAINERIALAKKLVNNQFLGGPLDISPTIDIFDNRIKTMDYIAQLGHDRFKRLVKKFDIKAGDDLFQCLCHSQGITGTGLRYSPAPDKHCDTTAPCKGGNWGCVATDLPKDAMTWAACAKKYKTTDGANIFNVFSNHINVSQKQRNDIIKNLQKRSQEHQKNCLPSLSKRSIQQMQSMLMPSLAAKAADLAEGSENICEEAVAVNLFLSEHQSKYLVAVVIEGITTWVLPDELFAPGKLNDAMVSKVGANLINKTLEKTMGAISFANNAMANMKLIREQIEARNMDQIYQGASDLFQKSKSWDIEHLRGVKVDFQNKIDEVNIKIEMLKPQYMEEYNKFYTRTMLLIGEAVDARRTKLEDELKSGERGLKSHYANLKANLLMERANLLLKRNIINDYRIPFLENGGCKKYLANREASCKQKLAKLEEQRKAAAEKEIRKALKRAAEIPYGETKTNPTSTTVIEPKK